MTITLRISDDESSVIRDYARLKGVSVSEFMRRAALEKIEDELDLRAGETAWAKYQANPESCSLDEIEKEFGLS